MEIGARRLAFFISALMMPVIVSFNCDLDTPDESIQRTLVLVEDRQIRAIGCSSEIVLPIHTNLIDGQSDRVTPQWIDLGEATSGTSKPAAPGITRCLDDVKEAQGSA